MKTFKLQTDSHTIFTTYQPSNIHFVVTDKRNNRTRSGYFYDCTLPDSVKEECEAVGDLFDYLQGKNAEEMQVDGDNLKFKVVRIKKERWYSLNIGEESASPVMPMEEEKMEQEEGEVVDFKSTSVTQQRDELASQNEQLRQEVQRLQATNLQLQQRIQNYESIDLKLLMQNGFMDQNEPQIQDMSLMEGLDSLQVPIMMESQSQQQGQVMRRLKLTCQMNPHYRHQSDIITKMTNQPNIFLFNEIIKRGERVSFGVQLTNGFTNNWIIFGVTIKQTLKNSYCYFKKGCLAFSGSIGTIFNQLDSIDLNIKPNKGDRIQLRLDGRAEWLFNGVIICTHKIGSNMSDKEVYPYLMLSCQGDSVRINYEE